MSKRSLEIAGSEVASVSSQPSKKHRSSVANENRFRDALTDVLENADELGDCLQFLQKMKRDGQHITMDHHFTKRLQQLSSLGHRLAPSFQVLGSTDDLPAACNGQSEDLETQAQNGILAATAQPAKLPIPSAHATSPWDSSEVPRQLPPLPEVLDPGLKLQAFRHPGVCSGGTESYERLEWLGDAYLELISTVLIYQTFPRLPSGQCSQIREQLVRNITLADFFRAYNLSSLAQLPPDLAHSAPGRGRSADKDLRKTQSDMFEAYLAAVIISDEQNGLPRAIEWVKGLWAEAIRGHQKTAPTNSGDQLSPKSRLANAIVVRGIVLRYEDMPGQKQKKDKILGLQLFTVGVYLTGWGETNKLLGFGTAKNKKDAGQKAALQALENKKMLKVYEQKKKAFVEAQDAARAAEDQS